MKKKFSQRSSTTQTRRKEMEREMGDDEMGDDKMRILREDLSFARDLAALRDKEIDELSAQCAQLRALASRLGHHVVTVAGEQNICPIARPRDEGARAKRAREEEAREEEDCVVKCGEDGGEKVGLPNCSHFIHLDCLMLMVAIAKRARCPFCNRPLAKSGDAQEKLATAFLSDKTAG